MTEASQRKRAASRAGHGGADGLGSASRVFPRVFDRELPVAVSSDGAWIATSDGRRFLDAAGGAIVVNVGHGERVVIEAIGEQLARTQYVHGTMFTTESVEDYAAEVAPLLPMDDARIYPVSGGSEAVETALKLARAYHLARGQPSRFVVIGRRGSYHGNTIGALDASGKEPLRKPYTPWLGRFLHGPPAYGYRCENPHHPKACGAWHAAELERMISQSPPNSVAAFIAEPVAGATLGAAVPCDDYWSSVVEVCRRHGVIVIADEVMTGMGRTGRWFGVDHWGVRPDIITAGKGTTSGYVPFGFAAASGEVFETVATVGFVHGFTWSHNALGAAAAGAVLRLLRDRDLVARSASVGEHLLADLGAALADVPIVGEVRGLGTLIGIELVRDRETKEPFARADRVTERVVGAARDDGLLLYSSTGHVDGHDGDLLVLGPPFVLSDDDITTVVQGTAAAIHSVS
ncbi:MAG: aminotransferase class III-fold pyridoxal phosphate-dependent enzyme [Actinomycetota bacterium]